MFLPFYVLTVKVSYVDLSRKGITSRGIKAQKRLRATMKSVWSDFFYRLKICELFMVSGEPSQLIVEVKN